MASKSSPAPPGESNKKQRTALFPTSSTPFDPLPHSISTASILSYVTRDEWFTFRLASRRCYEVVHGTSDVFHGRCPRCESRHASGNCADPARSRRTEESEALWTKLLIDDFYFGSPSDEIYESIHCPLSERYGPFLSAKNKFAAPHAFASWKHWRKIDLRLNSGREPGVHVQPCQRLVAPYFLRAARLWTIVERWCDDNGKLGRGIRASLKPGIAFDHFMPHGAINSHHKISALKAVYSFYAGQYKPDYWGDTEFQGLFGSVSTDEFTWVMHWAEPYFGAFDGHGRTGDFPIVYQSFDDCPSSRSNIYLNLHGGQLESVCSLDFNYCPLYATPTSEENICVTLSDGSHGEYVTEVPIKPEESVLMFFEEYARRLQCGYYTVDKFPGNQSDYESILAYPSLVDGRDCSRAITRGVEVLASAVFLLERSSFVYSVRFRLLTPNDGDEYATPEERGFDACQLRTHHWKITKEKDQSKRSVESTTDTKEEEIRGEGVFRVNQWTKSEHPLLEEGGYQVFLERSKSEIVRPSVLDEQYGSDDPEKGCFSDNGKGYFFHQVCIEWNAKSIEGVLQFVPGSVSEPKGDPFDVQVAPITFDRDPDFFYI